MFTRPRRHRTFGLTVRRLNAAIAAVMLLAAPAGWAAGPPTGADFYSGRILGYTDESGLTHLTNQEQDGASRSRYHTLVEDHSQDALGASGSSAISIAHRLDWSDIQTWVEEASRTHHVEPALLYAVMSVESGFNPHAVSNKGARGLMQLMPETALRYGVKDPFDSRASILAGARYLRGLLNEFHGNLSLTIAAYNAGAQTVVRYHNSVPPYVETQAYVPRVLDTYRLYGGLQLVTERE